jgi:hypothetical protein
MRRGQRRSAAASAALVGAACLAGLPPLMDAPPAPAQSSVGGFATRLQAATPGGAHVALFGATALSSAKLTGGAIYGGQTTQGAPFVLQLSRDGKRVAKQLMDIQADCTSGSPLSGPASLTPVRPRVGLTGGFKGRALFSLDAGTATRIVTIDMTGKLGARRGSGTARVHVDVVDKQTGAKTDSCDTGTIRWRAASAKGQVYGGSTSQSEPVVVQVSRDLRRVSSLRIEWAAPCSPQGEFDVSDLLSNFRLSASRAFGDVFSMTGPGESGSQNKVDYLVNGKLGKSQAHGRFQARVTVTDASGATTATCDSGVVSWQVIS